MSYDIRTIPEFDQRLKALAKRHSTIKLDLQELSEELADAPKQGVALGLNCYKVRMRIRSKGNGKSGGARVITCVHVIGEVVWLLTIFDKSDRESISDKELKALVAAIPGR
jgi:hypothetical protein